MPEEFNQLTNYDTLIYSPHFNQMNNEMKDLSQFKPYYII